MRFTSPTQLALVAFFLLTSIEGHTWIESIRNLATNGSFVGAEGFPRGFQPRSDPNFSDLYQTYQIENDHGANPTLCNPHAQGPTSQGQFARLQASPGTGVSLLYQENGHVTLPDTNLGKPANRGTVYIYATQQGLDDEKYYDVYQKWNTDGTGGDKRGKLISTQNFDDGQCFQVNNGQISKERQAEFKFTPSDPMGTNLWCQNDIVIPSDVDTSKLLTLYWIWKWDTAPGVDPNIPNGKNQTYTSCLDIQLTASSPSKSATQFSYVQGQDVQKGGLSSLFNKLQTGNIFAVKDYTDGMTPAASNTPIDGANSGSASTSTLAGSSSSSATDSAVTSSSTGAAPPPPPNSATTISQSTTDSPAGSVSVVTTTETVTVFVFGSSVGTLAPTGPGVTLSTSNDAGAVSTSASASATAGGIATVTQLTVATQTSYVTQSSPQQQSSQAAVTFTASDSSATIPTQSPTSTTGVVSQISDGQPQGQGPTTATTTTSQSQAPPQSSKSAASATTTTSITTISDNPTVQPVPTDSSVSFTFQPTSTDTVTFQSSPAAAATSNSATGTVITATTATGTSTTTSVTNQAPPPAGTTSASTSASAAATTAATTTNNSAATGTSATATFGSPLPSSIGKRCTPSTNSAAAKVKRSSKVFGVSEQPEADLLAGGANLNSQSRNHARQWRGGSDTS